VPQSPPDTQPVVQHKEPPKKVVVLRARPPVVILISEEIPAYRQVADGVANGVGKRATVVAVGADEVARKKLIALLRKPEYQQFVAIGLDAAKVAKEMASDEDEVIFCQIFNYKDHNLLGPRAKGVAALPSSAELFAAWVRIAPNLKVVGVITGPGIEEVIAEAEVQAKRHGITLRHKVVNSDKELLFEYKQMAPTLQGLWLLPDNRVLSGRSIRELMTFSVRNSKQVAVFSDSLLRLGGLLSVTSSEDEIVAKVLRRLDEAYRANGVPGPDLMMLDQARLEINTIAAKRYSAAQPTN